MGAETEKYNSWGGGKLKEFVYYRFDFQFSTDN